MPGFLTAGFGMAETTGAGVVVGDDGSAARGGSARLFVTTFGRGFAVPASSIATMVVEAVAVGST